MRDSAPPPDPARDAAEPEAYTLADVERALAALDALIPLRQLRGAHLFADLAALNFAHQVLDYGRSALLVLRSGAPSTAYPLVRSAFEVLMDLMLLAKSGADYDRSGARAYVEARVAEYEWRGRNARADRALGIVRADPPTAPASLRAVLAADARTWDRLAPGQGALLAEAWAAVRASRQAGRKHWSGLSRAELHARVAERYAERAGEATLGPVFESLYSRLASHSHARLRLDGHVQFTRGGRVALTSTPGTPDPLPVSLLAGVVENAGTVFRELVATWPPRGHRAPTSSAPTSCRPPSAP